MNVSSKNKTKPKTVKELRDELGELGARRVGSKETLQKR